MPAPGEFGSLGALGGSTWPPDTGEPGDILGDQGARAPGALGSSPALPPAPPGTPAPGSFGSLGAITGQTGGAPYNTRQG
jgi:hypothetical protein